MERARALRLSRKLSLLHAANSAVRSTGRLFNTPGGDSTLCETRRPRKTRTEESQSRSRPSTSTRAPG
jgi:hypothetical protein